MLIGECITPPAPTQLQKKRPACIACRSSCPCGESHRPLGSCEAAGRREKPPSAAAGFGGSRPEGRLHPRLQKGPACIACRSYCPCGESHRPPGPCEAAGRRGKPPSAGTGLGESRPEGRFHPRLQKRAGLHRMPVLPPLRGKPQAAWVLRSRGAQGKAPFRGGGAWRKPAGGPVPPPLQKRAGLHRMPAPRPCGESYRSSASCTGCSSYMGTPV